MMTVAQPRKAFTILEVVVVVSVIAVVISLLLAAIMKVREAAAISQSKNNLRQIILAVQNYADTKHGRLPVVGDEPAQIEGKVARPAKRGPALFISILPFIEGAAGPRKKGAKRLPVAVYLSPADPSAAKAIAESAPVSSYAANCEVFASNPRMSTTYMDGASNTIAFAEHYSFDCNGLAFYYSARNLPVVGHRATVSDYLDVRPMTKGQPPISSPSPLPPAPASTFQIAPRARDCFPLLAQTPHQSGMVVAMGDGGVRQIAAGVLWAPIGL